MDRIEIAEILFYTWARIYGLYHESQGLRAWGKDTTELVTSHAIA